MTFLLPPGINGLTIFVNFLDFLPFICYKNTNHVKLTLPEKTTFKKPSLIRVKNYIRP